MKVIVELRPVHEQRACAWASLPEVFEVRDDGFMYVLNDEPRAGVRRAAARGRRQLSQRRHLSLEE